jgi:amino acid transporter
MRRPVSAFDVFCLGVNAIIGSGIFLLPGKIDALLGAAAVWAFVACAAGLSLVALAFAELGSRFERDGGPYLYATAAFGPRAGFVVGWIAWATAVLSWAAVANAIAAYLATLFPAVNAGEGFARGIGATVILILAAINYRGVRLGARVSTALTIAKSAPLVLVAAVTLPQLDPARLDVFHPPSGSWAGFSAALWMALFTCQGFEVPPVIAGEVRNARRAVPRAVVGALLSCVVVYILIQLAVSAGPARLAGSDRPLADLAHAVAGPAGATFVAVTALLSIVGYNAGTALSAAHYLTVLAEDGFLPARLAARHPRFATPAPAIIVTAGATAAAASAAVFERLLAISVLAVVAQYASSTGALLVLRWRESRGKPGSSPGRLRRLLLPGLGLAVSLAFLSQARPADVLVFLAVLAVGTALAWMTRLRRRGSSPGGHGSGESAL